jgi:hypothetical protein
VINRCYSTQTVVQQPNQVSLLEIKLLPVSALGIVNGFDLTDAGGSHG